MSESLRVTIVYEQGDEGWIVASIRSAGALRPGQTREEARANVIDALRGILELRFGGHRRSATALTASRSTSLSAREAPRPRAPSPRPRAACVRAATTASGALTRSARLLCPPSRDRFSACAQDLRRPRNPPPPGRAERAACGSDPPTTANSTPVETAQVRPGRCRDFPKYVPTSARKTLQIGPVSTSFASWGSPVRSRYAPSEAKRLPERTLVRGTGIGTARPGARPCAFVARVCGDEFLAATQRGLPAASRVDPTFHRCARSTSRQGNPPGGSDGQECPVQLRRVTLTIVHRTNGGGDRRGAFELGRSPAAHRLRYGRIQRRERRRPGDRHIHPVPITMATSTGTVKASTSALSGETAFSVAWKHD